MRLTIAILLAISVRLLGQGNFITAGTWVNTSSNAPTGHTAAQAMGYEKITYVVSKKASCYLGAYKLTVTSEANTAIVCYSISENRWFVLGHWGYWYGSHNPETGHSQQAFIYDELRDVLWYEADGAA